MFVGRERELAADRRRARRRGGGRGQLVLLAGEPGIGKTSLADRAAALAGERGFTVLWGRCWEAGGAPAYWPWLDLIAELARGLDDAALARVAGDGASLLARSCRSCARGSPSAGGGGARRSRRAAFACGAR